MTHFVGKRLPRHDASLHVTGKAKFAGDLFRPGMLHARALRSAWPHARIVKIDTSRASNLPGVAAVLTAENIPKNSFGPTRPDQPVLAGDKVRYLGDPIAAVAATSVGVAAKAIGLIGVEYEPLPGVFDPIEAMKPGAPTVHGDSNVAARVELSYGDIETVWGACDELVEEIFRTPTVEHCTIEPHAALAEVDALGSLTVYTSVQRPSLVALDLSRVLNVPLSNVRVIVPAMGGGFGGKHEITVEPLICLLALMTQRPVKMTYTREEEFRASTVRHSMVVKCKSGVKTDGTLVARQVEVVADTGAYLSWGQGVLSKACAHSVGPYRIPHVKIDGFLVHTNSSPAGAMRGFGVPQVAFAYECHTDTLAARLGMDPLEFRLANALGNGDCLPTGQVLESVSVTNTIREADAMVKWKEPDRLPGKRRGVGMASMIYPIGGPASYHNPGAVLIKVDGDGSVTVLTGATDVGQGSTTILAQIAAEELGIRFDDVKIISGDTGLAPFDVGSVASRVTYVVGNATRRAARQVKRILLESGADMLQAAVEDLEVANGSVWVIDSPERRASFSDVARQSVMFRGNPPIGSGSFDPSIVPQGAKTGSRKGYPAYVFATHIAQVEVDTATGEVEVLSIAAAHDCGTAINPMMVEGQIEGGISMGLGYALLEEMVLKDGAVQNAGFADYHLPTACDMPEVQIAIVDHPEHTGPFGAKGIGEPSLIPTAPAIVNAIHNAVGVRMRELPVTPDKLLSAIRAKSETGLG